MLEPAILHKGELERLFAKEIYSERYFYYVGYPYCFELPNLTVQDNIFRWAIVENGSVWGYLSYRIDTLTDSVSSFGLMSFDEGNPYVIRDVFSKLEELVAMHHRVEWRMIEGNHAKRGYDNFCKRHGGNILYLRDVCKDLNGMYRGEYIYEIVRGS